MDEAEEEEEEEEEDYEYESDSESDQQETKANESTGQQWAFQDPLTCSQTAYFYWKDQISLVASSSFAFNCLPSPALLPISSF